MTRVRHGLIVLGIAAVICGLAQAQVFADTIACWNFNGDFTDSAGNGHDGTLSSGTPAYVNDAGRTALQLDGNHVSIPGSSAFAFSGSATIEAEVRTSVYDYCAVIDDTGEGRGWWMRTTPQGYLQANVSDGAGGEKEARGGTVVTDGQWHHLAAVYDRSAGTLSLYVDYNLESLTDSYSSGNLTQAFGGTTGSRIGLFNSGLRQFTGDIDFVRLSNAALAPSEFARVPEPSSLALAAVGSLGLLAYVWRKRR